MTMDGHDTLRLFTRIVELATVGGDRPADLVRVPVDPLAGSYRTRSGDVTPR